MTDSSPTAKKRFSIAGRIGSFRHALRGILLFLRNTHNAWIHMFFLIVVVLLGFAFGISRIEWIAIILACALVLVAEAFNSAIEIDIDLTSPEYHPYARDTKDVAAGAVLISAVAAAVVGLLVFLPYVLAL